MARIKNEVRDAILQKMDPVVKPVKKTLSVKTTPVENVVTIKKETKK